MQSNLTNFSKTVPWNEKNFEVLRNSVTLTFVGIFGIGLLGNTVTIVLLIANKLYVKGFYISILNLSIADLLVLLVCVPSALIEMHSPQWPLEPQWLLGEFLCKLSESGEKLGKGEMS